jgi:hypothetical protein
MGSRTLLALTLLTAGSTAAFAQAPGDYDGDGSMAPGSPQPPPYQPQYAPQYAPPPPQMIIVVPEGINPMRDRWSVGLSIGSFGVAQNNGDGTSGDTTKFDVGELSLRFRVIPHLELELAIGGGNQRLDDGTKGDTQMQTVALAARWRFAIHSHWNWWLMSGLGVTSITSQNASSDEMSAAQRPMVEAGIGLEHRWDHFALQAELKGMALGPTKNTDQPVVAADGSTASTTTSDGTSYSGGQFTVGASYYF